MQEGEMISTGTLCAMCNEYYDMEFVRRKDRRSGPQTD
jgi:hypothetical protein